MMPETLFQNRERDTKFLFILSGALAFFLVSSFVLDARVQREGISVPTRLVENVFPTVALQAKSAYVFDLRSGEMLYAKNAEARLPLASLTKLMSALVALDLSPSYGTVKVTDGALTNYGDSGLQVNEKWSLKNLLDFSLLTSSNDGIRAVALSLAALEKGDLSDDERVASFVVAMNSKASELGLKNTYFWNETGLDESAVKNGAYGSAHDVATLLGYLLTKYPEMLEATRERETVIASMSNIAHAARNTNSLVGAIPGLLASKTGFTDIAGGNLAFAFDPELGRPIVVAILGSSAEGRFTDAEKLIKAVMKYINNTQ